jgi:hypothetical protein
VAILIAERNVRYMTQSMAGNSKGRAYWPVGTRVSRKTDTAVLGTVVEQDGIIKVKWDGGRTSYYRHGELANVQTVGR